MKKILYFLSLFLIISIFLNNYMVQAQNSEDNFIPEKEGIYDVPGHPNLKVKVFVYKDKSKDVVSLPITSCNDPISDAVVDPAGWKLPSTWTYRINQTSAPSNISSQLSTIVRNSYDAWQVETNGKVAFSQGENTVIKRRSLDYQNIIAWNKISGNALAVTYTWYNPSTKQAVDIDTIMNSRYAWSYTPPPQCSLYPTTYDVQNILTHELGHTVGLNDHYTSAYTNNTMYGYGSKGEVIKDTLTNGDKIGAHNIYN